MLSEVLESPPEWLVVTAIATVSALAVAVVFVVGSRLFPDRPTRTRRVSGEGKRRREIRAYLDAIGESFLENHTVRGHRVAFYLPDRDVAVTFDARTYYRLERSKTAVVLAEHELPGTGIGARLPFETPTPDSGMDDAARAAFTVLGLGTDASAADITAAYRERVKQAHPDHGGSHEDFRRVREAYTTAKEHTYSTSETS